jgi:hypothetical protein
MEEDEHNGERKKERERERQKEVLTQTEDNKCLVCRQL